MGAVAAGRATGQACLRWQTAEKARKSASLVGSRNCKSLFLGGSTFKKDPITLLRQRFTWRILEAADEAGDAAAAFGDKMGMSGLTANFEESSTASLLRGYRDYFGGLYCDHVGAPYDL